MNEPKQVEEELKSQIRLLTAIINSLRDIIIFSLDNAYCYTAFNEMHREEMKKVWNADIEIGMNLLDCMQIPELRKLAKQSMDRALAGEIFSEIQHQPDPDIYYEFNWNPVWQNKEIVGVIAYIKDITEQKQMEIALEKSKKTTENYLNVAAELILSIDVLGNIVMLNDSGHKLLGYNQGELIGKNWFKTCLPEEILNEVFDIFEKLMNGDIRNTENYENTVKSKSGEIKTLLWHNAIVKDFDGKATGTISSGNDITESKTKEKILRDSEELYRRLFNEDLAGNFVSTIDGQLLQCNTAYADIMGFESADEMLKASTQSPLCRQLFRCSS
jgi:PAS domain S-box-containing protein